MTNSNPIVARAKFAFTGKNNDELNFVKNDMIYITQQLDGGWWEGTLNNVTGWFPSNYVEIVVEKDKLVRSRSVPNAAPMVNNMKCISPDFMGEPQITNTHFRKEVLAGFQTSETIYLKQVQETLDSIIRPIKKSQIMNEDDFKILTCNMEDILELQKEMFAEIESNMKVPVPDQRIGRIFLAPASELKSLMLTYCWNHPKAVEILTEKKTALTELLTSLGKEMKDLVTGLSEPFRHLDKYPIVLQELERSLSESDADRGDIQRSCLFYKEIKALCEAARKQKETQLEFLYTRQVEQWASFEERGKILYIGAGTVSEGEKKNDRCLALFSNLLLILEITKDPNIFNFVTKIETGDLSVKRVEGGISFNGKESFQLLLTQSFDISRWMEALEKTNGVIIEESQVSSRPQSPRKSTSFIQPISQRHSPDVSISSNHRRSLDKKLSFGKGDLKFNHELGMIIPEGLETTEIVENEYDFPPEMSILPFSMNRQMSNQRASLNGDYLEGFSKLEVLAPPVKETKPQLIVAEQEKILVEEVEGGEVVWKEKSLIDTVYSLRDQVSDLRRDVTILQEALVKEQQARRRLEEHALRQSTEMLNSSIKNHNNY
ncbi:unnamed protein product [Auanema sp. JU1783]|nr:unnamed protein product [Auanema sp. JU1783]